MDTRKLAEALKVEYDHLVSMTGLEVDWDSALGEVATLSYETRLAVAFATTAAITAQGECRVNGLADIAQLFPVLEKGGGLHWECNHPSPHESEMVAPLKTLGSRL